MIVDTVLQRALWRLISGSHLRGGLPAAHLRRRPGGLEMWPDVTSGEDFQWRSLEWRFIGVSPGVFDFKALPGATRRSRREVADCDSVTGESLCLLKSMPSWQVLEQILKDTKKERNDMKWYEMIRQILKNATRKWNEKSKLQLKSQRWPRRDWQVIICNNDVLMMSAGARSYPRYTCLIHLFPPERVQEWHECSHHCTWLSCRNRQTDAEKTKRQNTSNSNIQMLIMFKKKPNKNKNKSVFWKNVKKFPGFFPFFRFPFAEKRTASRWASCGAREAISLSSRRCIWCNEVIESHSKYQKNTVHFFTPFSFFYILKEKEKWNVKKM